MSDNFWRHDVVQSALDRDVEAAVAEQLAILAQEPHNAVAYFALGTLFHFQGKVEPAVQYFEKSIELDPSYAPPHLSLGRIHAVRGDYQQAWQHARAAEALGARGLVEMLERYPNLR